MKTKNIIFRTDVQNIPYKIPIVVLFKNETIHSVKKRESKWTRYNPITKNREDGFYDRYILLGVLGIDDDEIDIEEQPIAWCLLEEIIEE